MTSTLDAPVYELKKDSEWHRAKTEYLAGKRKFYKEIEKDFPDNGFTYYHDSYFGVLGQSKDYETYKDHLRKNADKNGVYIFKKTSPLWKVYHEKLKEFVDLEDSFKSHDVFGWNNVKVGQRVGDRYFYSIKIPESITDPNNEVEPIEYADYLQVVMDVIKGGE